VPLGRRARRSGRLRAVYVLAGRPRRFVSKLAVSCALAAGGFARKRPRCRCAAARQRRDRRTIAQRRRVRRALTMARWCRVGRSRLAQGVLVTNATARRQGNSIKVIAAECRGAVTEQWSPDGRTMCVFSRGLSGHIAGWCAARRQPAESSRSPFQPGASPRWR